MSLQLPPRFVRSASSDAGGRAVLKPRAIYILPTRHGLMFALLLFLLLIGSINYANNLGFMLTFMLAGIGLVAMLHTWRNLVGLSLMHGKTEPVFAGEKARFQLLASNRQRQEHPGIEVGAPRSVPVKLDLQENTEGPFQVIKDAPKRGRLALDRIVVATRYPTGLFRAWSYVDLDAECLVYPTPGPRSSRDTFPQYNQSDVGDKGVGADDFVGLRQYRPGDSPRHIDWKAVAREQGIQTKQFGGDRADRLWLDFDQYGHLDTETILMRLCRGVLDAAESGSQFGLRIPGQVIQPAAGTVHRNRCLAALALFGEAR